MRLLEIDRSAAVAWSSLPQHASLLATGTVAGTLGIDFDTSAHLELFSVDFAKKTSTLLGKTSAPDRFNKLVWGLGNQSNSFPRGIIAGGLANGAVVLWDASKIIDGNGDDALISTCEKHAAGPVQGLDFNPFQPNLLASGGSDSEIFIWDLAKDPHKPVAYNPGTKTLQQTQDNPITSVAWNKKVQHILGSVSHNGTTQVWDLKAKRAVLSFSDPNRKLRCRTMAWNPEGATQLITASEDDSNPVIELWDLRNTYAPAKILEGHTAGIWGISWCPIDNDLLLSCGKDNKTLCWSVKTGEIQTEVDSNNERWNFDVQWSPRVPAILSTSSLDGKVRVYSLADIRSEQTSVSKGLGITSNTVAQPSKATPPKWLKRPAGVCFGFGGKIAYFKRPKTEGTEKVVISQVVTDKDIIERASKLEQALQQDPNNTNIKSFCEEKIANATSPEDKSVWGMLKVILEDSQRTEILRYLGYDSKQVEEEVKKFNTELEPEPEVEEKVKTETKVDNSNSSTDEATQLFEDLAVSAPEKEAQPLEFNFEEAEGAITKALLIGNFELAVECCIKSGRMADALILAAYGGSALWAKTQAAYFKRNNVPFTRVLSSVVNGQLREIVEQTQLNSWKSALAILCTYAKREEFAILSGLLGDRLLASGDPKAAILCFICAGNIDKTVLLWTKHSENSSLSLQTLIEKVSVFRRATRHKEPLNPALATKFAEYAHVLASQGKLGSALQNLSFVTESKLDENNILPFVLLDRLYHSQKAQNIAPPPFPFKKQEVPLPASQHQQPRPAPKPTGPAVAPYVPQQPNRPPGPFMTPTPSPFPNNTPSPFPNNTGPFPNNAPNPFPSVPSPSPFPSNLQQQPPPVKSVPPPTPHVFVPNPTQTPSPTPIGPPPTHSHAHPHPHPHHQQTPTPIGPPPTGPVQTAPAKVLPPPPSTPVPNVVAPEPKRELAPPPSQPIAPPPTNTTPIGPPPTGGPGNLGKTPASSTPATPPPPKPAQTTQESQYIIDQLNSILATCSKSQDPKVTKLIPDVRKRFEPLFEKLSKNDFSASGVSSLTQFVQAINSGDVKTAQNIHIILTQNNWDEFGSSLMIGLKRLVEIAKN